MKKKSLKFMVTLNVMLAIILMSSIAVSASSLLEKISAYINHGITIKVNGETFVAKEDDGRVVKPITYNGRTYLPVRFVGDAFGIDVDWDGNTQTVYLGEKPVVEEVKNNDILELVSNGKSGTENLMSKDFFKKYPGLTYKSNNGLGFSDSWVWLFTGNPDITHGFVMTENYGTPDNWISLNLNKKYKTFTFHIGKTGTIPGDVDVDVYFDGKLVKTIKTAPPIYKVHSNGQDVITIHDHNYYTLDVTNVSEITFKANLDNPEKKLANTVIGNPVLK